MSLDNIQLPPFLIGELYKNSLVDTGNQQAKPVLVKKKELPFLGKNQKNILIITNEKNAAYLADEDLNFLVDILKACRLSLLDTAIVNFAKNKKIDYEVLQEEFKPGVILFFGIEPSTLEFPLQFPNYQLQSYNNQTYLSAPPLKDLAADVDKKKQLWACLKKLFSI